MAQIEGSVGLAERAASPANDVGSTAHRPLGARDSAHGSQPLRGLNDWLTTADHTKVGRLYVITSLLFGVGALVLSALVAFERIDPTGLSIFTRDADALQVNAMAVWGLLLCVVLPLLAGLAISMVPLQVGARNIAFPRAAAASFWLWIVGSGLYIGAYASNGGFGGGDSDGVSLFLLSMGILCLSLILAAICVATTVLTLRAPGMGLDRIPMFAHAAMVQSIMIVVTLPVLLGGVVFQYVDHYGGRIAFGGSGGMEPYLQWATRQPTTGLMLVPALGLVADIVAVFTGRRLQAPGVVRMAITLSGLVSFGAFAQDRILDKVTTQPVFIITSILGLVGPLAVLGVCALALASGKPKIKAPLVWALFTGLGALAAALAGALLPIKKLEILGTAYEQAQFDLAVGVGIVAALAALVYWGPKLWGRTLANGPASGLSVLALLGVAAVAIPEAIAGFIDQPRGNVNFAKADGTAALNGIAAGGYVLLALVILGTLALLAKAALGRGEAAGADPWEGHTLEWATSSPPPPGNFAGPLPVVGSDRPLLDAREA